MGISGWRLATIIQTPLLVQSSFTTYTMKLLFIFQRRLANRRQQYPHPGTRQTHQQQQQQQQQQSAPLWSQRQQTTKTLSRPGSAGPENGNAIFPSMELAYGAAEFATSSTTVGVRVTNATVRRHNSAYQHENAVPNGDPHDELYWRFPVAVTVGNGQAGRDATKVGQSIVRERRPPVGEEPYPRIVDGRPNGLPFVGTVDRTERNGAKTNRIARSNDESTVTNEIFVGGTERSVRMHRNSVGGGHDPNHKRNDHHWVMDGGLRDRGRPT